MGFEAENEARKRAFARLAGRRRHDARARSRTRCSCTACPRIAARKSPPTCIDGPQSVVWDEAENRLHAQKALLEYLVCGRVDRV